MQVGARPDRSVVSSMLQVDPFEHLAVGAIVSLNVGETVSLSFLVERADPSGRRVYLHLESDEGATADVEFVDWRVYMVSRLRRLRGTGPVEVVVPTEVRAVSRNPLRLELEVLEGTAIMQRRNLYRTTRPGMQASVHVDGAPATVDGDVLDLSASGLALGTYSTPPAPGAALLVDLLLPTGETLTMRGRLIGSQATGEGGSVWRWNVQFEEVTAAVRDALTRYIHRAQT